MLDPYFDAVSGMRIAQGVANADYLIGKSAGAIIRKVHAARFMSAATLSDPYNSAVVRARLVLQGRPLTTAHRRERERQHGY
ncbi:hypothetical protein [Sphingomonas sp. S2-65]|uniref:hypothetical protein n=1 Tax=Sphingomonas sp. S2-65 TaxID=2903960 RepID=UPI001F15C621|nr:hypothetical protein [Sphingomonas sp. S2-65]UYY57032.1 hypothetical protein LZ586_10070 [Sphingomonas sp. S2-65]